MQTKFAFAPQHWHLSGANRDTEVVLALDADVMSLAGVFRFRPGSAVKKDMADVCGQYYFAGEGRRLFDILLDDDMIKTLNDLTFDQVLQM